MGRFKEPYTLNINIVIAGLDYSPRYLTGHFNKTLLKVTKPVFIGWGKKKNVK